MVKAVSNISGIVAKGISQAENQTRRVFHRVTDTGDSVSFSSRPQPEGIAATLHNLRTLNIARQVQQISADLHEFGQRQQQRFGELCGKVFVHVPHEKRIKKPTSIGDKALRKLSPEKAVQITEVNKVLTDLAGARGITKGTQKETDRFVQKVVEQIEAGQIKLTSIRNYRGKDSQPYLTQANINTLTEANQMAGHTNKIEIRSGDDVIKKNGYTAAHLTVETRKGLNAEFQLKGHIVNEVDGATHLIHDLSLGKNLSSIKSASARKAVTPLVEAYQSLTPKQIKTYNHYTNQCYENARIAEDLGQDMVYPQMPKGLPKTLELQNISDLALRYGLI